jgi:hypothetical protein
LTREGWKRREERMEEEKGSDVCSFEGAGMYFKNT